jgi:hypothetical protein
MTRVSRRWVMKIATRRELVIVGVVLLTIVLFGVWLYFQSGTT